MSIRTQVGGRGKTAPYTTTLIRIPVPLIDQVDAIKDCYQQFITDGGSALEPPDFTQGEVQVVKIYPTDHLTDREMVIYKALINKIETFASMSDSDWSKVTKKKLLQDLCVISGIQPRD